LLVCVDPFRLPHKHHPFHLESVQLESVQSTPYSCTGILSSGKSGGLLVVVILLQLNKRGFVIFSGICRDRLRIDVIEVSPPKQLSDGSQRNPCLPFNLFSELCKQPFVAAPAMATPNPPNPLIKGGKRERLHFIGGNWGFWKIETFLSENRSDGSHRNPFHPLNPLPEIR
jgi:hypothetical protein